jgi:hypothetical protein
MASFGEVSKLLLETQRLAKSPVPEDGTVFAITNLSLGVGAHSPHSPARGGAHNRAGRENYALTTAQIANLKAAANRAREIGLPLNRMITIHWEAAGVPLEGMAGATGHFADLLAKTLARHESRAAWLWVHENGDGKGGHCHMLAHVPAPLVPRLTRLQKGWLRRITGQPYKARVICSKPVGGRLGLEMNNPELYAVNLEAALVYMLKQAGLEAALHYTLTRLEAGGRVIGKRCGTSQNIGAKARRANC